MRSVHRCPAALTLLAHEVSHDHQGCGSRPPGRRRDEWRQAAESPSAAIALQRPSHDEADGRREVREMRRKEGEVEGVEGTARALGFHARCSQPFEAAQGLARPRRSRSLRTGLTKNYKARRALAVAGFEERLTHSLVTSSRWSGCRCLS